MPQDCVATESECDLKSIGSLLAGIGALVGGFGGVFFGIAALWNAFGDTFFKARNLDLVERSVVVQEKDLALKKEVEKRQAAATSSITASLPSNGFGAAKSIVDGAADKKPDKNDKENDGSTNQVEELKRQLAMSNENNAESKKQAEALKKELAKSKANEELARKQMDESKKKEEIAPKQFGASKENPKIPSPKNKPQSQDSIPERKRTAGKTPLVAVSKTRKEANNLVVMKFFPRSKPIEVPRELSAALEAILKKHGIEYTKNDSFPDLPTYHYRLVDAWSVARVTRNEAQRMENLLGKHFYVSIRDSSE